jgi:Thioredoxin-like
VLNTDAVQDVFTRRKVALLQADWTRRDPAIGAALAALGRNGVPAYVFFRPGKEPLLLPEVLRRQDILDAVDTPQSAQSGDVSSEPGPARKASGVRATANQRPPATRDISRHV